MKDLMIKAADIVEGLENVEEVRLYEYPLGHPHERNGHTHSLVIHFEDDENGEARESKMYLFNKEERQWEPYKRSRKEKQ